MDCPFGSNMQGLKFTKEPETTSLTPILTPKKGQRNINGINHCLGLNWGSPLAPHSHVIMGQNQGEGDILSMAPISQVSTEGDRRYGGGTRRSLCLVRVRNCPDHQCTASILHPLVPWVLQWLKLAKTQPSQNIYISAK